MVLKKPTLPVRFWILLFLLILPTLGLKCLEKEPAKPTPVPAPPREEGIVSPSPVSPLDFVANFNTSDEIKGLAKVDAPGAVSVEEFLGTLAKHGYRSLSFHPIASIVGEVYFHTPPGVDLASFGYPDAAPPLTAEGKEPLAVFIAEAHKGGFKVFANIQGISHTEYGTTLAVPGAKRLPDDVYEHLLEFLLKPQAEGGLDFDGVTGEVLPFDRFPVVRKITSLYGKTHMHDADRQELLNDPTGATTVKTIFDLYPDIDVLSIEDYELRRVGPNSIVVGTAKHFGKKLAVRSSTFDFSTEAGEVGGFPGPTGPEIIGNIFLFRRIQADIAQFTEFVTYKDAVADTGKTGEGLEKTPVSRFGAIDLFSKDPATKPFLNLIIHLGKTGSFEGRWVTLYDYGLGAITNFGAASGMDLVVSELPVEGAAAYFLITTGFDDFGAVFDLPDSLVDPLVSMTSPVFLMTLAGLPATPGWVKLREAFGIGGLELAPIVESGDSPTLPYPTKVTYLGKEVRFAERFVIGKPAADFVAVALPATGLSAEVLLSGLVGDAEGALFTKKEKKFFINGNRLDPDVAFILTDLHKTASGAPSKGHLLAPGDYWSVIGSSTSTFLGFGESTVAVYLPLPAGKELSIFRRKGDGAITESKEVYDPAKGLGAPIASGEIIVVR